VLATTAYCSDQCQQAVARYTDCRGPRTGVWDLVNDLRDLRDPQARAAEGGNAAMASGTTDWLAAPGNERAIVCPGQGW